jgi:integrase
MRNCRDTFAVELLLSGVPLERVSVLLGHSSIRITERYCAPWTRSRQEQIEADLKAAWSNDPVVLTDWKGARELQGKTRQVN